MKAGIWANDLFVQIPFLLYFLPADREICTLLFWEIWFFSEKKSFNRLIIRNERQLRLLSGNQWMFFWVLLLWIIFRQTLQKPDNLSLDRKLKVLSFMEFFNYDYHAEKYEVIGREMSIAWFGYFVYISYICSIWRIRKTLITD